MAGAIVKADGSAGAVVGSFARGADSSSAARSTACSAFRGEWVAAQRRIASSLSDEVAAIGEEANADAFKVAQTIADAAGGAVRVGVATAKRLA